MDPITALRNVLTADNYLDALEAWNDYVSWVTRGGFPADDDLMAAARNRVGELRRQWTKVPGGEVRPEPRSTWWQCRSDNGLDFVATFPTFEDAAAFVAAPRG